MSVTFETSYHKTLGHEGRYSNDSTDRGGETYKGIARKYWGKWKGWKIIDKLKKEPDFPDNLEKNKELQTLVKDFYKKEFWDKMKLSEFDNQDLVDKLFDIGVNQGVKTSIKYLQRSLNLFNNDEKYYKNIGVDGVNGTNTMTAYKGYMATAEFSTRSYDKNINTLLNLISYYKVNRYVSIAENDEGQEKFIYGWINRV